MKWIKAHLTIVVCGAVSVAAIAMIALGIFMSTVQETLAQDAGTIQSLKSAQPVNERVIQQLKQTLEDNTRKLDAVQKKLEERGGYQPLHADVFPDVNPNNRGARFLFKTTLMEVPKKLVAELNAKQAPSQAEVQIEAEEMNNEKLKAAQAESLGVGGGPSPTAPRTASPFVPSAVPGPGSRTGSSFQTAGDRPRNLPPERLAQEFPEVRLAIRRAREIYCYVGSDEETFGKWPEVTAVSTPTVEAMWYAQMGVWIEQDVVKALAGLNNAEAEKLKGRQQIPWVGNLPVKHVKQIAINDYVVAGAAPSASGGMSSMGAGASEGVKQASFTRQVCTPAVDVINFSVRLVVDARMLPAVIDELCKAGFFTPVLVNYSMQPVNQSWVGYIYGSSPAIDVSIDFEGSFLRTKYEKWMPPTVKTAITAGQVKFAQGLGTTSVGPAGAGPRQQAPMFNPGGLPGEGNQ